MKGKTTNPLTILVDMELLSHPKVKELEAQGHAVEAIDSTYYHLILSTKAWRWDEKYVELAVKAAQKAKKERA